MRSPPRHRRRGEERASSADETACWLLDMRTTGSIPGLDNIAFWYSACCVIPNLDDVVVIPLFTTHLRWQAYHQYIGLPLQKSVFTVIQFRLHNRGHRGSST